MKRRKIRFRLSLFITAGLATGAATGVGVYPFVYADGASYRRAQFLKK